MAEERIIRLMKRVPLFAKMPDSEVSQIADQCVRRECKKDQVILVEEELGQTLFIILRGTVKITRTSDEGREVIITMLRSGDFFGELSLLDGKGRSATVVAMEDAELFTLRRSEFLLILEQYPSISVELLKVLADRIRKCNLQIENLTLQDAVGRVGSTLIHVAESTGYSRGEAWVIPKLPVQQDLANMAGTARETISRIMALFEAGGLIERDGHRVIIPDFSQFKSDYRTAVHHRDEGGKSADKSQV
ncbi:Crp/Fnr family transcriptional regulator [candidate division KSB1 bacterium]|nr:Crp/Fnr family transcriptional regulator [candidate division KSB1 bacterium]